MLKTIITAAALVTAIAPAAANIRDTAQIGTVSNTSQISVDVSDLDLAQPADRQRADRRINAAIRSLCDTSGPRPLSVRAAEAACREQAVASVRPAVR